MIQVGAPHTQSVEVPCSAEHAFSVIGIPDDSIRHFSGLEKLEKNGDVYTWTLQKVGTNKVSLQVVYGCRYTPDATARTVVWEAVPGIGNGLVSGRWQVEALGPERCRITIHNDLKLSLNISRLLKIPAQSVVARENKRMVEAYVANIVKTITGGDGRVFNG